MHEIFVNLSYSNRDLEVKICYMSHITSTATPPVRTYIRTHVGRDTSLTTRHIEYWQKRCSDGTIFILGCVIVWMCGFPDAHPPLLPMFIR